MSDSQSDQVPKAQVAASGGPPKPPKKTARGLEDGSGGGDSRADLVERLIAEYKKRLLDPKLRATDQAKVRESLKELEAQRRKGR
jgi:hypothetical protein